MSLPDVFLDEARDLLARLQRGLLSRPATPDAEHVNELFRAMHTLKGASGLFALDGVVKCAHVAETLLDEVREGRASLNDESVAALLEAHDELDRLLQAAAREEPAEASPELLERLHALAEGEAAPKPKKARAKKTKNEKPPQHRYQVDVKFGEPVMLEGFDPISCLGFLASLGTVHHCHSSFARVPETGFDPTRCYLDVSLELETPVSPDTVRSAFEFILDSTTVTVTELAEEKKEKSKPAPSAPPPVSSPSAIAPSPSAPRPDLAAALSRLVKVPAERLDALVDLVGELVISAAMTQNSAQRGSSANTLEHLATLNQLVSSIRDAALALRMVPVGETFNRFHRVVRDLSKQLGKDVQLELVGEDTELDKAMVERLVDPLTHIVRNSMDHGLETPEERASSGKPATGHLTMTAAHEGGTVVIEVKDDGRGLNRERIEARARERGLVPPQAKLTPEEVDQLIFLPGFSSAEQVSELSGRGVGMDVVKRTVESLRGTVEVQSKRGEGTRLKLRLPLTLAIIDGFIVGTGRSTWVVPLKLVKECLDFDQVLQSERDHRLSIRGEVVPFLRLRDLFRLEGERPPRESVVVVEFGDTRVGLVIDRLLGAAQTVIKPLGPLFEEMQGVSGATLLGTGEVGFILDVPELVKRATALHARRPTAVAA